MYSLSQLAEEMSLNYLQTRMSFRGTRHLRQQQQQNNNNNGAVPRRPRSFMGNGGIGGG